jgi:nitrogen fixation NifU-like protein
MMTGAIKGKKVEEAEKLYGRFHDLVTGQLPDDTDLSDLGKLAVFSGVKEYPARVKCASLCWHTLKAALDGGDPTVTTE